MIVRPGDGFQRARHGLAGVLLCAATLAVSAAWPTSAMAGGGDAGSLRGAFRGEPGPASSANGVIVKLRGATANVPAALKSQPQLVKTSPDADRLRALLARLGMARDGRSLAPDLDQSPTLTPQGAAAQLLRFQRRLNATESQALVARLRAHPEVEWVVANEREPALQAAPNPPNDPFYAGASQQWWLQSVSGSDANAIGMRLRGVPGFASAWQLNTGTAVVAVLDTGITAHPELTGRVLPGFDFVSDWDPVNRRGHANDGDGRDSNPSDPGDGVTEVDRSTDADRYRDCAVKNSTWHGTIIAGMVAGVTNNGAGVAAAQWGGRVLPVRVAGKCGADVADVIDGMRWAAGLPVAGVPLNANPARVINMSFGGVAPCLAAYAEAITDIRAAPGGGAILVAAAGNTHADSTARPSNCPGAIGVVALNRDGFKATYSSFGATVDIATIGGDDQDGAWGGFVADSGLLTITNDGNDGPGSPGYARVYGTSFAAPVVSAVAALMVSFNPSLSADQLIDGLTSSARPHVISPHLQNCSADNPGRCACTSETCGAGILDARQALLYARDPAAWVKPAQIAAVLDNEELRAAAATGADRPPLPAPPGSTGGGSSSVAWSLALLLAALALHRLRQTARPDQPTLQA